MHTKYLIAFFASSLVSSATSVALASPLEAWAIIERVDFTPNETATTSVKVHGVFSVRDRTSGIGGYGPAQKGFADWTCAEADLSSCRRDWEEMKALIGTNQCAYFGFPDVTITVHPEGSTSTPQPYAWTGVGRSTTDADGGELDCVKLKASAGDAGAVPDAASPEDASHDALGREDATHSDSSEADAADHVDAAKSTSPASSGGGGCSAARQPQSGLAFPLVLVAALGLVTRRRRARR